MKRILNSVVLLSEARLLMRWLVCLNKAQGKRTDNIHRHQTVFVHCFIKLVFHTFKIWVFVNHAGYMQCMIGSI